MNILKPEQRLQIVEIYLQNEFSVKNVFRAFRPIYDVHNRTTERTIRVYGLMNSQNTFLTLIFYVYR